MTPDEILHNAMKPKPGKWTKRQEREHVLERCDTCEIIDLVTLNMVSSTYEVQSTRKIYSNLAAAKKAAEVQHNLTAS